MELLEKSESEEAEEGSELPDVMELSKLWEWAGVCRLSYKNAVLLWPRRNLPTFPFPKKPRIE
jgi:hypothetical protein